MQKLNEEYESIVKERDANQAKIDANNTKVAELELKVKITAFRMYSD
jgi:hypothetical protein